VSQLRSLSLRRSNFACVLVADADADTRSLYRELLRTSGCDVVEVCDGREALTEALVRQPSLIVTEVRLPFIDGVGLCEALRANAATRSAAIIVVTADGRPDVLDRVRAAGADVVLVKPFAPAVLLREIASLGDRFTQSGARRPTDATQVNDLSSRRNTGASHAACL
jgi:CheY-like chemotaxis protein